MPTNATTTRENASPRLWTSWVLICLLPTACINLDGLQALKPAFAGWDRFVKTFHRSREVIREPRERPEESPSPEPSHEQDEAPASATAERAETGLAPAWQHYLERQLPPASSKPRAEPAPSPSPSRLSLLFSGFRLPNLSGLGNFSRFGRSMSRLGDSRGDLKQATEALKKLEQALDPTRRKAK